MYLRISSSPFFFFQQKKWRVCLIFPSDMCCDSLMKYPCKPLRYTQECNVSFLILQVRYCEEIGISADAASRLYIYAGISSTVGRVLVGRLCDLPWANALYVSQAVEFVGGTALLSARCTLFWWPVFLRIREPQLLPGSFCSPRRFLQEVHPWPVSPYVSSSQAHLIGFFFLEGERSRL